VTPLEQVLYKTRKSPLAAASEMGLEYILDSQIALEQCADCSIWLFAEELIPDLDNQGICQDCLAYYGP
jgi:hypothetical protein